MSGSGGCAAEFIDERILEIAKHPALWETSKRGLIDGFIDGVGDFSFHAF